MGNGLIRCWLRECHPLRTKHRSGEAIGLQTSCWAALSCLAMRIDGQASVRVIMVAVISIAMGVRTTGVIHAKIILHGKTICDSVT